MQPSGRGVPSWHALSSEAAFRELGSTAAGLKDHEARRRLSEYGPNRLPAATPRPAWRRFLAQFNNVLLLTLLASAVVTAGLEHWIDTQVILLVVFVNAVVGFVQEGRATRALEAIRGMLTPRASVLRDRRRITIAGEDLVPGDVVLLEPGDRVPADLRLVVAKNLQIQEAALTGESIPAQKSVAAVAIDAAVGDRSGMAFSGTLVTAGHGMGIVVATGAATELGRISAMLGEVPGVTTPLLRQMAVFARWMTLAVLVIALATFVFGVLGRGYAPAEMFIAVVGLSVAAIPEGLPTILTITLAIGVQRMASRHAIIRQLPAVETLGAVSIICTDKTGTLTRNEMTVRTVVAGGRVLNVTGTGYAPEGGVWLDGTEVAPGRFPVLADLARAALLCNDAALRPAGGEASSWSVEGDPMEAALIAFALKLGANQRLMSEAFPRADHVPFDAQHRFMATLHHAAGSESFVCLKGAPERILALCNRQRDASRGDVPIQPQYWHERIAALAAEGQRVLAVAERAHAERSLAIEEVEDGGFVLLGLVGMIDPPRPEAVAAVRACREAGIQVKMITGDHAITAAAIAQQLGLDDPHAVLTGRDLDALDDEGLRRQAVQSSVFARTSPEHKLRLVAALQAEGAVVAMTGDGVNDAPALKRSDIGIAMGQRGTEAAKEAARMVLADDNFASIVEAVRQGRTVYDNLKKAIVFLLPINGGEALSIIAALLAGTTLPITPLQILWVNMVSSVALAMTLAFEPEEPDVMRRPPRRAGEPLLSGFLVWRVILVSLLILAGVYGMFAWARARGLAVEEARTIAVNTIIVLEIFYLFSVRYLHLTSLTVQGLLGTRAVSIGLAVVTTLQLAFTFAPFMQGFFGTRAVGLADGLTIVAVGASLLIVLEGEKFLRRALPMRRWRNWPA